MKAYLPAAREVDSVTREEPTRSASAAVYALLAQAAANPLGLEDWLGELVQAFGARLAALAALLDAELVAQHICPGAAEVATAVNWPWQQARPVTPESAQAGLAVASRSIDGRSSFLTVAVPQEGIRWLLCLEDACNRTWSGDEQAALTLAALGLFQLAPVQPGAQRWVDWSQKIQAQQRLEDAAAVVGQLAHDFNNVLTSVLGFAELTLAQLSPGSPLRNLVVEAYTAAQQGSRYINRLSFFSTRKTVPNNLSTSLRPLVEEEAHRWRQSWDDAITLEIHLPPDLPALAIDGESLRVLLDKLLANAREAIDSSGTVCLSARAVELSRQDCLALLGKASPGSYVELSVADSGRGFSALARRRVLTEPFFSTKPRYRGLGLATVYGILVNHGGGICLEHGPERGSLVRVFLPARRCASDDRRELESAQVRECASGKVKAWPCRRAEDPRSATLAPSRSPPAGEESSRFGEARS